MGPRERWTRRTQGLLGLVYAVFCALETMSHLDAGVLGLSFWFGTLFVATACVLGGTVVAGTHPYLGDGLILADAIVGVVPTAWSILVPLLAAAVVVLTIVDLGFRADARAPT